MPADQRKWSGRDRRLDARRAESLSRGIAVAALNLFRIGALIVLPILILEATALPLLVILVVLAVDAIGVELLLYARIEQRRDPYSVDDVSVLAAGPPAQLRPCVAAVLFDGRSTERALGIALLELAQQRLITIHDDPFVGNGAYIPRAWIEVLARRRLVKLDGPERVLANALHADRPRGDRLDPIDVTLACGSVRGRFDKALDDELVDHGWHRRRLFPEQVERPSTAWLAIVAGAWGGFVGVLVSSPLMTAAYLGLLVLGITGRRVVVRPVRTREGERISGMLRAYQRTLELTLAASADVWEVLVAPTLSWVQTPDRMVVWAMALGLEENLAGLFARSHVRAGTTSDEMWFPEWFGTTAPNSGAIFRSLDHLLDRAASIPA